MNKFTRRINPFVDSELKQARNAAREGQAALCFAHLERAHVLGQTSTYHHVRVHWHMLVWAVKQSDMRECAGQAMRIVGAATKTALGRVPSGNTGGANVSAFKRMPVPQDLAKTIAYAQAED